MTKDENDALEDLNPNWDYFDRVAIIARALYAGGNGTEDTCVYLALRILLTHT